MQHVFLSEVSYFIVMLLIAYLFKILGKARQRKYKMAIPGHRPGTPVSTQGRRSRTVLDCGASAGRLKHDIALSNLTLSDDRGLPLADLQPHIFLVSCQQVIVPSDVSQKWSRRVSCV